MHINVVVKDKWTKSCQMVKCTFSYFIGVDETNHSKFRHLLNDTLGLWNGSCVKKRKPAYAVIKILSNSCSRFSLCLNVGDALLDILQAEFKLVKKLRCSVHQWIRIDVVCRRQALAFNNANEALAVLQNEGFLGSNYSNSNPLVDERIWTEETAL